MRTEVPTFDAMPQMMANILKKLETLEQKFDALQSNNNVETDAWFSLQDLCNYLPNHPAEQTVYGWTSNRTIPFPRMGKASSSASRRLMHGSCRPLASQSMTFTMKHVRM